MFNRLNDDMITSKLISLPTFPLMKFSLIQGVGVELEPVVKVGDKVKVGTLLAKPKDGLLGGYLHSSVSGKVVKIEKEELEKDLSGNVIYVQNDNENSMCMPLNAISDINIDSLCKRIVECGVIGFGGGGFPLDVKLEHFLENGNLKTEDKYIFINGASSDGYYTADICVMRENLTKLFRAIEILKIATGVNNFIFVIRKGTEKYLKDLIAKIDGLPNVYLYLLPNKMCIGDEKIIAKHILGLDIKDEEVLTDYGHCCINVQTLCAMVDAVDYGLPCTTRVITCAGGALKTPCNAIVKVGSIYEDVIEAIGGEKFALSKFTELEDEAKNSYLNYLSLRDEFKQDETDEDVKKEMVEMRKKSNSSIMEFLKAEKLYSKILLHDRICGGYLSGIKKDDFNFSTTKTTLEILLLTKSESKTREKLLKKFIKKNKNLGV